MCEEAKENLLRRKRILIYEDEGVTSIPALIKSLASTLENTFTDIFDIALVSAYDLKNELSFQNVSLLIFPGGRDLPYVTKLRGHAMQNIHKYVFNGGAYLGLCAGAYFASDFCEFEKGTSMEVCGKRYLKFFPGKASGCVFPGFEYHSEKGSQIVNIKIQQEFQEYFSHVEDNIFPCYYNGGCEFVLNNKEETGSVKVVGRYHVKPDKNAIVFCQVGKGKALLSGVHPEINYDSVEKSKFADQKEKLVLLENAAEKQQALFQGILRIIFLSR